MRKQKVLAGLLTLTLCLTGSMCGPGIGPVRAATTAAGEVFRSYKCGTPEQNPVRFLVLNENEAQLGDGSGPAVDKEVKSVYIPKSVTEYGDFEVAKAYRMTGIADFAFEGCDALEKIQIEGEVTFSPNALAGLPETAVIETGSRETKKALLRYGFDPQRVRYIGLRTNYVAFGDSIAAGYALPGYKHGTTNDDRFPMPDGTFVQLIGNALNSTDGPAVTSNQAVSGWTSEQLLKALKSGEYHALLEDADVVTITIGSNDLLGEFIRIIKTAIEENFTDETIQNSEDIQSVLGEVEENIQRHGAAQDFNKVIELLDSLSGALKQINREVTDNPKLLEACEHFRDVNQPAILEQLHQQAPGAEIYWNTLYNPFYGQTFDVLELFPNVKQMIQNLPLIFQNQIPELPAIDLDKAGDFYIQEMNKAFAQNKAGYHCVDIYGEFNHPNLTNVKISNTPLEDLNFDPHPNLKGHQRIAELYTPVIQKTYTSAAPEPDLSSEKAITRFKIGEKDGSIDGASGRILVKVPWNTDLSRQAAVFEASPGAEVRVGDAVQISGETFNDFTGPVSYTVVAEDLTRQVYEVTVEKEKPAAPQNTQAGTLGGHEPDNVSTGLTGERHSAGVTAVLLLAAAGGVCYAGKRRQR